MIARLSGKLISCTPDRVVLDVGGVGYDVSIPLSTFYGLRDGSMGGTTTLHVHTHVREDAILLFGFSTDEERTVFASLLAVSGVGPKLALAVLSGIGVAEFRAALAAGERSRLERIPGIGRKTAERILLELRTAPTSRRSRPGGDGGPGPIPSLPGVSRDAVSALVNLGYAPEAAERAVRKAGEQLNAEEPGLDVLLREALRGLVR